MHSSRPFVLIRPRAIFAIILSGLYAPAVVVGSVLPFPGGLTRLVLSSQLAPRVLGILNSTAANTNFTCNGPLVSPSDFLDDVGESCQDYAVSLQTKPEEKQSLALIFEIQDKYTNCTTRRFFDSYPDAPDGFKSLGVGGWVPYFEAKATKNNSRFETGPPVQVTAAKDGEYPDFLPIFEEATRPFFEAVDGARFTYCPTDPPNMWNQSTLLLYKSFEVATTQYQRCSIQKPFGEVARCTTETVAKLQSIPNSLFIYGGDKTCDSPSLMYVIAAVTILMDLAQFGTQLWWDQRRGKLEYQTFSWVQLTLELVKNFGKPLIFAYTMKLATLDTTVAFTLEAVELLIPTSVAFTSVILGLYMSKGWGYQIMIVDSICAFLGGAFIVLIQGSLFSMDNGSNSSKSSKNSNENPITQTAPMKPVMIGLLLSLGPWALILAALGISAIIWQCILPIAMFKDNKPLRKLGLHALLLYILIILIPWLTPIFALWEACWILYDTIRERRRMPKNMDKEEKRAWKEQQGPPNVFPLVRLFRSAAGDRLPFFLRKTFLYWASNVLALVAFVGRWIALVGLMSQAGEAFCPSRLRTAVAATILFHFGMILLGFALQFVGLSF